MQYLLPLILIGLSGALFLTWIDPTYNKVTALQEENKSYEEALAKTAEIRQFRQDIQADFKTIEIEPGIIEDPLFQHMTTLKDFLMTSQFHYV